MTEQTGDWMVAAFNRRTRPTMLIGGWCGYLTDPELNAWTEFLLGTDEYGTWLSCTIGRRAQETIYHGSRDANRLDVLVSVHHDEQNAFNDLFFVSKRWVAEELPKLRNPGAGDEMADAMLAEREKKDD
jgi:hypothetical protein